MDEAEGPGLTTERLTKGTLVFNFAAIYVSTNMNASERTLSSSICGLDDRQCMFESLR